MADNVTLPGTGTVVAADDVSSVWFQQVKLVDGTLGNTTAIAAGGGVEAGALRVTIASDSTGVVSIDDNGAAITVDNGGTFAVQATLAAETTKVIGTVNVAAAQTIATTNAGTFATQVDGAALTALQLIDDPVFADEAGFTVGSSKVNVAGFLADDASADVAAEGQAVAARTTLDRKQVVMLGESGANLVRGGGSKTDTSDQSIMGAVASKYNYLHWVSIYNSSSTNTYVNVKDGSTVVAVLPCPAYGGAVFNLPVPIRSTVNTAINLAAGASATTVYLYGGGYVGY
jgi:hypothetical protein